MNKTLVRPIASGLLVLALAACASAPPPPAAAPSAAPTTNVNPITGSRGGSASGGATAK